MGVFLLMKILISLIFCCTICVVSGQKLVTKAVANPESQRIYVAAKNCFQVNLTTAQSQELEVKATIEGEYLDDLIVKIEEQGKDIFVSTGFLPNFIHPNDKLSAHKVVSIALEISVPNNANIQVFGTNTNLIAQGQYKNLKVTLADGNCTLKNISAKADIKTQKGNIILNTESGTISTHSQYGKVSLHNIQKGNSEYLLRSVEGNIAVIKTE